MLKGRLNDGGNWWKIIFIFFIESQYIYSKHFSLLFTVKIFSGKIEPILFKEEL